MEVNVCVAVGDWVFVVLGVGGGAVRVASKTVGVRVTLLGVIVFDGDGLIVIASGVGPAVGDLGEEYVQAARTISIKIEIQFKM